MALPERGASKGMAADDSRQVLSRSTHCVYTSRPAIIHWASPDTRQEQPTLPHPKTPLESAENGLEFFSKLQLPPGNWGCEYGGPMFLISGFVITWYVTKTPIPEAYKIELKNYLYARQHPEDGGWGLHIEGDSSVFGTAMNYVALRLLGADSTLR